jgi:hypothetical protein
VTIASIDTASNSDLIRLYSCSDSHCSSSSAIGSFSGNVPPPTQISSGPAVRVHWSSANGTLRYSGWKASWQSLEGNAFLKRVSFPLWGLRVAGIRECHMDGFGNKRAVSALCNPSAS